MNKTDLKKGEYYHFTNDPYNIEYIFIFSQNNNDIIGVNNFLCEMIKPYYSKGCGNLTSSDLMYRLATSEEKHWLNTCIKQDKYITKEEAMKTFKIEYVKCLSSIENYTINKIYKVNSLGYIMGDNNSNDKKYNSWISTFEVSNKEAYDNQPKHPEYIKCVTCNDPSYYTIGKIYKTSIIQEDYPNRINFIGDRGPQRPIEWQSDKFYFKHHNTFKSSTKEEFDLQNKPKEQTIEDILEICKQQFPIGSKVNSVYSNNIVVMDHIIIQQGIYTNYGRQKYCLYSTGSKRYATLISSVSINTESIKQNTKTYTLEEIKTALNKEYDKNDVIDIIKTIEKIK